MTPTPTPRTDAAEILWNDTGLCVVPADFARQLERELAELTEWREMIDREVGTLREELAAEREQVAILHSDEKRLVAFAKTYRMNAEILSDKLAAERALADRLAIAIEQVLPAFGAGGDLSKAWDTWSKARK